MRQKSVEEREAEELGHHPEPREYVKVAILLAIVTAVEVAASYWTAAPAAVVTAALIFFAFIKFALVVLWFMHLKFDSLTFRRLFVSGLAIALTVYFIVLVVMFGRGGPAPLVTG